MGADSTRASSLATTLAISAGRTRCSDELAAFDALPQAERDWAESDAMEEAWQEARDDDKDNYICGRLTARGIL